MNFLSLDTLNAKDKTVLLRADLNVPMNDGAVTDTARLDAVIPTLTHLKSQGAKIVILSHLGRPKGQRIASLSLQPVANVLAERLGHSVSFVPDTVGEMAQAAINSLENGQILMLENLRFHAEEKTCEPEFVSALANLGDIFVNDAFSAAHRAHASITGLANAMPAYAGNLMAAEINALQTALDTPKRPVIAIVGGSKVSTKLPVLKNMLKKVDTLVIGGAMANTFLLAQGHNVGASLAEADMTDEALGLMDLAQSQGKQIFLPTDGVVASQLAANVPCTVRSITDIRPEDMILDIGPESVAALSHQLETAKTVLWNGPLGAFEFPPFDGATTAIARKVAKLSRDNQMISVGGGGDTVAALKHAGADAEFSYISTAGGAFLEWLEGKTLPGVAALEAAAKRQKNAA